MTKFATKYQKIDIQKERNSGELLVEQDYVNTEAQIRSFIRAGERLRVYRKESCDLMDDSEDFRIDPTREPNFDLADATIIASSIQPKVVEKPVLEVPVTDQK